MKDILGIDIGGTSIKGSLIRNNKIIKSNNIPTKAKSSKKIILGRIFHVIDTLMTKDVKGIGIGFPAPIVNGIAYEVANIPNLNKVNLKKEISKRYKRQKLKVEIENDANCFTLTQAISGYGKKHDVVVGVTLGTGIGIGVVINKKIFPGKRGTVGELSKAPFKMRTLEDYTSAKYFKSLNTDPLETARLAIAGDKRAIKRYKDYGRNLGAALSIIVNAYDPDIIILGGKISRSYRLFRKSMMEELKDHLFRRSYKALNVKVTNLQHSSELGAALLVSK